MNTSEQDTQASSLERNAARRDRGRFVVPAALVLLTVAVFGRVVTFQFTTWDDPLHVYNNVHIYPATATNLAYFWTHAYRDLYIPLSYMVFAAVAAVSHAPEPPPGPYDCFFYPFPFHLASVILHVANVLLAYAFIRRFVKNRLAAGIGAALFAIHPFQAESVGWIAELRGLTASFFSIGALLAYVAYAQRTVAKRPAVGWIVLATVLYVAALLSKPSAVTLALIALVLDYLLIRRPLRTAIIPAGIWILLALPAIIATHSVQPVPIDEPLWHRPLIAGDALAFYIGKFLWPLQLGFDYGRAPFKVAKEWYFYVTWLVPAAIAALLWWQRARSRKAVAIALFIVAAFLPVLGLVQFVFQVYSTVSDRYAYLPLLGAGLGVAFLCERYRQRYVTIACCCALLFFGVLSYRQAGVWSNSYSLFTHDLKVNPKSWASDANLAFSYMGRGQMTTALSLALESIKIDHHSSLPDKDFIVVLLVLASEQTDPHDRNQLLQDATNIAHNAMRVFPNDRSVDAFLGDILAAQGRYAEAVPLYESSIKDQPEQIGLRFRYGFALEMVGRRDDAVRAYQGELKLHPAGDSIYDLRAMEMMRRGDSAGALELLKKGLTVNPRDTNARALMGILQPQPKRP